MTDLPIAPTTVMRPTTKGEWTILAIVFSVILDVAAVIAFLGLKTWGPGREDVVKDLAWLGLGALLIQGLALLVQLSSKVGSKVQTSIGASGLSVEIEGGRP